MLQALLDREDILLQTDAGQAFDGFFRCFAMSTVASNSANSCAQSWKAKPIMALRWFGIAADSGKSRLLM
ncbi:hypothetical protein BZL41_25385 [Pseudomonas sp. PIC25]|nr:hypothetical protein BZL41_25385 [Pseudomonas sp. PIC25]